MRGVPAVTDYLPFLVVGITNGSLYGLAAMGLVLTYKTTGIFNFAHGAMAAAAAFAFWKLHAEAGWPWPVALVLSVALVGVALGSALEWMTRAFIAADTKHAVVATVGLLLGIQGLLLVVFGPEVRSFPQFLPGGSLELAGVQVEYAQILTAASGAVLAAVLFIFFRRTRLGAAMRAVVDDSSLLSLAGDSPARVRTASWVIGSCLAALSGILIAPSLGVDAFLLTLLIVQAFGACAIGRFSSLPLTYVGGLVVGVTSAVVTKLVAGTPTLSGLPPSVPFLILFGVLVLTPARRLATPTRRGDRMARTSAVALSRSSTWVASLALGAFLVAVPFFVGTRLPVYTRALTFALIFLSLGLLVTTSRQISLAHAAFAALGATTFSHLTAGAGVPWLVALVLAGVAVIPLGAMVAVPAIRLAGVFLGLATFGLGVLLEQTAYPMGVMFGARGLRSAPRPKLDLLVNAAGDRGFYFVVLAVVLLSCVLVAVLLRSRLGRLLRALGDSPTALLTQGLAVNTTRVAVFCLSAFLAGIAGALLVAAPGQVSRVGFGPFESLMWVAVLAIAGRRVLPGAFVAAALLVLLPSYLPDSFLEYQPLMFGVLALVTARLGLVDWRSHRRPERVELSPVRARRLAVGAARSVAAPLAVEASR
jgi:branched-subunit amino acid ABC-type transport system permease component